MGRWLRRIGIVLVGIVGVIVIAVVIVNGISYSRQQRIYAIETQALAMESDSATRARGRHLATAVGVCGSCHGTDFGGSVLADNAAMGRLVATNLTAGRGGIGRQATDADLVRAIRHGVGRDSKSLIFMPSESFQAFSDADLAALIVYLRSVPPVDRELPAIRVGPMARVLHLIGFPLLPAERIDHRAVHATPEPTVSVGYGEYLANVAGCRGCHGPALAGGAGPGPNITPGAIGSWSEQDFFRLMRSGKRPDGRMLTDEMPWKSYGRMSDVELRALWLYLRSVPPKALKGS